MEHYHDPTDRQYMKNLRAGAPEESKAFIELNNAVGRTDGEIPLKYRELISVAVALTTQCAYCIETHVGAAKAAGATEEEISETVFVTAALRAGGAVAHGRMAIKLYQQAD